MSKVDENDEAQVELVAESIYLTSWYGEPPEPLAHLAPEDAEPYRNDARAALKALREYLDRTP